MIGLSISKTNPQRIDLLVEPGHPKREFTKQDQSLKRPNGYFLDGLVESGEARRETFLVCHLITNYTAREKQLSTTI